MAVTFVREVLTDSKPAIRVDGASFSPAWFRVRLLGKDIIEGASGEPPELLIKAVAYRVDATGIAIIGGEGHTIERLIAAESLALGTAAMTNEKKSIVREAIKKAARSLADIGDIAQLPTELVD